MKPSAMRDVRRSLYFEDLVVGDNLVSEGRTVTETDLTMFAALSGDWNQIHNDQEFASRTQFGQRVVHGLIGPMIITGMLDRMGIFTDSMIAALEISSWRYLKPIFVGDTLHFQMTVSALRAASDGRRGIVDREFVLINQRNEAVQQGSMQIMIARGRKR